MSSRDLDKPIFIAGHNGMVGAAIKRQLESSGYTQILYRSRAELDLLDNAAVRAFFTESKPAWVFLAAAKVGGIWANNTYPADFIYQNLSIQNNVIDAAYQHGADKLLFLGSSCIYPRDASQPMTEDALLSGPLEPTNEWYAIAKIAGIKLCQAYRQQYGFNAICLMPTNLYGPGDNFDLQNSHVLPALIRKFSEASSASENNVTVWGSGSPRREFLHVDDLASACLFAMENYDEQSILNVGVGKDISISELVDVVAQEVGYSGVVDYDRTKPDGTPRKLLDVSKLKGLGWSPSISLRKGIADTVLWYQENKDKVRS
jgi:GDP-L-fucose synthase